MPASVTNAFLNGYGNIDLSTLLNDFGAQLPASDANFVLDLGGLLSPAGSLINGIGYDETPGDCRIGCASLYVPTSAVGPIASMIGWSSPSPSRSPAAVSVPRWSRCSLCSESSR